MNWLFVLGIALGLAMDAFAVAIAVGARLQRLRFRPLFRLSFHFGLFQFLMPIIGWLAGEHVKFLVESCAHWIAFALLAFIGVKMIRESRAHHDSELTLNDPTRKWSLVMLSIATSIDALAVGFSIALLDVEVISASIVIGVVASTMTAIGMTFGRSLGARFGRSMELIGGVILIAIGVKIVLENL